MNAFARLLAVAPLAAALAAQNSYETDFESLTASPAGTPLAGQDSFFIGPVAGSLDNAVFTYAGNTLGVPQNPNGGNNFIGAQYSTAPCRSQRTIPINPGQRLRIDFDVCANFIGSTVPTNNIGSLSLQPSATSRIPILLARWATGATAPPATWNADISVGPTVAGAVVSVPDVNFQGLPVGVWHRLGCTIDLATNEYVELRITNGATSITTVYVPPAGMLPLTNPTGATPTDFRMFTGGAAGNVFAIDNISFAPNAEYIAYGSGCAGSAGTPTLGALTGSRPALGSTFTIELGNMANPLGIFVIGFSDTSYGGNPLPLDLTPYGMPGCSLLAEPFLTSVALSGPTSNLALPLPNNAGLMGVAFFNQGFVLDPPANATGFVTSNACRGVLGR